MEAASNLYLRKDTYWGRFKIRGSEKRMSLRTSDPEEARLRLGAIRAREERLALGVISAQPEQWVYFLLDATACAVKVGFSKAPEARAINLRTGSLNDLELLGYVPGSKALEMVFHDFFRPYHIRREWFHATPEVLAFLRALVALKPPLAS